MHSKALGQVFSSLAMGSAFWHGSHTYAGNVADNRVIEVLSYLAHQATLDRLGPFVADKPVLTDLSLTKRPYSALEINDQLIDVTSTGGFVEAGTTVRVVEVHGAMIMVEPVEEAEA